jgi:carbon monoxide dehydrogenase subunit G
MADAVVAEIEVAAPPDRVYELMMDPRRLGEWVTIHRDVPDPPRPPLSQGDSFEQKLALAGKSFTVRWRVTRAEPPRAADWHGSGPAGATARVAYRLEQAGEGTRVRYESEFDLPAGILGRAAGRLLVRSPARREAERSLERLKQLLEA